MTVSLLKPSWYQLGANFPLELMAALWITHSFKKQKTKPQNKTLEAADSFALNASFTFLK